MLLLRAPLSRKIFESMVKTDHKKFDNTDNLKLTENDKYAFNYLNDVIMQTQRQYQQDINLR